MLTAVIIVKDEERYLARLLNSLTGIEKAVILDTGSTDRTKEIAALYPFVELHDFVWSGWYDDARNAAASYVKTEWMLWLDGDMWLDDGEVDKIRYYIANGPPEADALKVRVIMGSGTMPSDRVCKSNLKFYGAVHETVQCERAIMTPIVIHHEREETIADREAKNLRYKAILVAKNKADPRDTHSLCYLRDIAFMEKQYDELVDFIHRLMLLQVDYLSHYYLGVVAFERGKPDQAIRHCFDAIHLTCTDPRPFTLLADSYHASGKVLNALIWYEFASSIPEEGRFASGRYTVSRDDYDVIPLVNKAVTYASVGIPDMLDKADACFDEAIRRFPETPHAQTIRYKKSVIRRPPFSDTPSKCTNPDQRIICAFTTAYRETLFLWIWMSHYASEVGESNMWVLYEPGDDSITEHMERFPRAHFVEAPNPHKSAYPKAGGFGFGGEYVHLTETWRKSLVTEWQGKLLETYQCVVFGDCDEVLVPPAGLIQYCQKWFVDSGLDRIRSVCWQPVHRVDEEPPVVRASGSRVLADRTQMWRHPVYDKTLLVRKPQVYCKGYHFTYGPDGGGAMLEDDPTMRMRVHDPVDPFLPMLHLWRMDFDYWCNAPFRSFQFGADRERGSKYFKDHVPWWESAVHAEGPPVDVHPSLKNLLVLR